MTIKSKMQLHATLTIMPIDDITRNKTWHVKESIRIEKCQE
jgi:hypothetical protein